MDKIEEEIWSEIDNFSKYRISNKGRVWSKCSNKILKQQIWGNQYPTIALLRDDGTRKCFKVHVLVAKFFIPNPNSKPQVNHIDGNKLNYSIDNLEWVTASENTLHALDTGLYKIRYEDNPKAKLTKSKVLEIRKLRKNGTRVRDIMDIFNIGQTQVYRIINNKHWQNI